MFRFLVFPAVTERGQLLTALHRDTNTHTVGDTLSLANVITFILNGFSQM